MAILTLDLPAVALLVFIGNLLHFMQS